MAQHVDSTMIIDGPGEIYEKDAAINLATHGATPCTTTVLTMVSDPRVVYRDGDIIKVATGGTDFSRISDMSATTITLETALLGIPATGALIYRQWRYLGATQGGIELSTATSTSKIEVDQSIDPVNFKATGRDTTVKANLVEYFKENIRLALGLPSASVTVSSTKTITKIGTTSPTLQTSAYLITGLRKDGSTVSCKIQKASQKGAAGLKFDKSGNSMLPLELECQLDTTQATGEELLVMEIDTAAVYNYGL